MIITIQGPIGCGKTTIISILQESGYTAYLIESGKRRGEPTETWNVESPILPYPRTKSN